MTALDIRPRTTAAPDIRTFETADLPALGRLAATLGPATLYQRFFVATSALPQHAINALAALDHAKHEAVAAHQDGTMIGWAQYDAWPDDPIAVDLAVLVGDPWQRQGHGPRLVAAVLKAAERNGFTHATATILPGNRAATRALHRVRPDAAARLVDGLLEFRFPIAI